MLKDKDIQILRSLATQYAQYASLPEQKERKRLWLALNSGHMERPLVLIDQLPWVELDVDGLLKCEVEDPYWREVECDLRRQIYKWKYMPADMVLNPYVSIPIPTIRTGWGIEITENRIEHEAGNDIVSHEYINQLQTLEDVEKLQTPTVRRDHAAEKLVRQQADIIFDGIIPYRSCGGCFEKEGFRVGPWDWINQWMGSTDIYIDFMDEPELIHAIMRKTTDGIAALIDQYNEEGLFDVATNLVHCSHTFSEDLPSEGCDPDHPQSKDSWGFSMAQLMSSCSPAITKEFEVDYMDKTFSKMGAVYYGCCERLDDRMDIITRMPNIRKISCSPWSDREHFAEVLPQHIIMSNKPNPAILATSGFDADAARQDIQRTIDAARRHGRNLEMLLKDVSTVQHDPQRLWDWARLAVDTCKRSV